MIYLTIINMCQGDSIKATSCRWHGSHHLYKSLLHVLSVGCWPLKPCRWPNIGVLMCLMITYQRQLQVLSVGCWPLKPCRRPNIGVLMVFDDNLSEATTCAMSRALTCEARWPNIGVLMVFGYNKWQSESMTVSSTINTSDNHSQDTKPLGCINLQVPQLITS